MCSQEIDPIRRWFRAQSFTYIPLAIFLHAFSVSLFLICAKSFLQALKCTNDSFSTNCKPQDVTSCTFLLNSILIMDLDAGWKCQILEVSIMVIWSSVCKTLLLSVLYRSGYVLQKRRTYFYYTCTILSAEFDQKLCHKCHVMFLLYIMLCYVKRKFSIALSLHIFVFLLTKHFIWYAFTLKWKKGNIFQPYFDIYRTLSGLWH